MSKIFEFYTEATSDESSKLKLKSILDGEDISQVSDDKLVQIGGLAKELGYEITLEEAKEFLNPTEAELTDEDLDAVAGGKGPKVYVKYDDMQHDTHVDWERLN